MSIKITRFDMLKDGGTAWVSFEDPDNESPRETINVLMYFSVRSRHSASADKPVFSFPDQTNLCIEIGMINPETLTDRRNITAMPNWERLEYLGAQEVANRVIREYSS